jgi:predicted DNA-binding transcriptional regulator AlpA
MSRKTIIIKMLRTLADNMENDKQPKYNSNLTEEEMDTLLEDYARLNDEKLNKVHACRFLNMSRATFDRRIAEGKIPRGKKEAGWKELYWSKRELEQLITHD